MLIRPTEEELANFGEPDFIIYNAGQFPANRFTKGMSSTTSVEINFKRMEMVILGTEYAGEMKKGVFSVMVSASLGIDLLPRCLSEIHLSNLNARERAETFSRDGVHILVQNSVPSWQLLVRQTLHGSLQGSHCTTQRLLLAPFACIHRT